MKNPNITLLPGDISLHCSTLHSTRGWISRKTTKARSKDGNYIASHASLPVPDQLSSFAFQDVVLLINVLPSLTIPHVTFSTHLQHVIIFEYLFAYIVLGLNHIIINANKLQPKSYSCIYLRHCSQHRGKKI